MQYYLQKKRRNINIFSRSIIAHYRLKYLRNHHGLYLFTPCVSERHHNVMLRSLQSTSTCLTIRILALYEGSLYAGLGKHICSHLRARGWVKNSKPGMVQGATSHETKQHS